MASFNLTDLAMPKNIVPYNILKRALALLLGNQDLGDDNCEFLVQKLDAYIQQIRRYGISNELLTSLSNLKAAIVCLRACLEHFTNGTEETAQQPNETDAFSKPANQTDECDDNQHLSLSCRKDAELQKELVVIKESDKFKQAVAYFRQSNAFSEKAFKKDTGKIKIIATKVRVIGEVLGNLTNFSAAADNCTTYISELHHETTSNLPKSTLSKLKNSVQNYLFNSRENDDIMRINVVVFCLMKEFLRQPLAMLDWPMINAGDGPEKHHPILGKLPSTNCKQPDPFTYIAGTGTKKVRINSSISAVNCTGDIFAKDKVSSEIVKVTPKYSKWYSFTGEGRGRKIVSISIDCSDCKVSTKSQRDEASAESSETNRSPSRPPCRGKMYILARMYSALNESFCYYLYVVDMSGRKLHEDEIDALEKPAVTEQEVTIFCIKDKNLLIIEQARQAQAILRIWNKEDKVKETIKMTKQLENNQISTVSFNGEIVCSSHDQNRLNIYSLNEEGRNLEQPPPKISTIDLKRTVKTVTYSDELVIIICNAYNYLMEQYEYHLVTYTKDGQLIQDIKLNNDKYGGAKLISHGNGPVLLLDNYKLLYLKR